MSDEFIGESKANFKTLFKEQDEMKKDIDRLEANQDSLKEITTILKITQKQYEDHHKVVEHMNENLIALNSTVDSHGEQIANLGTKVGELEEDGKIDTRKIKKEIIYKSLPSSIVGLIFGLLIAYLVWAFGWH